MEKTLSLLISEAAAQKLSSLPDRWWNPFSLHHLVLVRLTERCGIGSGAEGVEFQQGLIKLDKEITGCLKRETSRPLFAPHFLVGSGGTFTTLAELVMASKKEADIPVAGYKVSHAELSASS